MVLVVHASNFGVRPKGAFLNNVERKLTNGLIRNGHQVVSFSDREAAMAGSPLGPHRFGGRKYANKSLTELCLAIRPDVLILGQSDVIAPETVEALRERLPAMRALQWSVDALFERGNIERLTRNMPVVDATLVTTAGEDLAPLAAGGHVVGFLPNPADASIERAQNHLKPDLPFDLFYACGNPADLREIGGQPWNMDDFASAFAKAAPAVRPRWAGLGGQPTLGGAAYQAALEGAAIGLNLSRRSGQLLYSSDRLAHVAGNGLAVLIDRATGYDRLFSDDEMAFYAGFDELAAQAARLAADPPRRMALAGAGRARYLDLFNEQRVASYLLDVAFERLDPAAFPWPTLYPHLGPWAKAP